MRLLKAFLAITLLSAVSALAQQPVNNAQVAGSATATAATGVQKVGIVGVAGTTLDGATAGVLDNNIKNINNVTPLMGNGTTGTGSLRVTIASDNTAFSVNATLGTETTKVIGTVRMQGNVGGVMDFIGQNATQPANSLLVGGEFNTTPTTLTNGNASPLQLDSSGKLLVNVASSTLVPSASTGGMLFSNVVAAASDNATLVSTAAAHQLYGVDVFNNAAYPVYVKLYDKSSSPTSCGATSMVKTYGVQAGTGRSFSEPNGLPFANGIGMCIVKGITLADDTAVLISDAAVSLHWK